MLSALLDGPTTGNRHFSIIDRQRAKLRISQFVSRQFKDIRTTHPNIVFPLPKITVFFFDGSAKDCDVEVRRAGQNIEITLNIGYAVSLNIYRANKIATFCFWFINSDQSVATINFDTTDGHELSTAKYSPSSYRENVVLLPDAYFFRDRGFLKATNFMITNDVDWFARSDDIVWRGGVNGVGYVSYDEEAETNPTLNQRIAMANKVRDTDVDFKFVIPELSASHKKFLTTRRYLGDRVDEYSWVNRKFAIDIDGFTNTWSNLYLRMKFGCCVLKVDSPCGFKQWYYEKLNPFENYVPVKADLSDWEDVLDWVRSHPKECESIAKAGQNLVNSMTFETETTFAARRIEETWNT